MSAQSIPHGQLVACPRLTYESVATHSDGATARIEPFEAIEIELAALWPAPPEPR